jgi:NADPH:quinone reductase-like Zn-dependent oxidoreductase
MGCTANTRLDRDSLVGPETGYLDGMACNSTYDFSGQVALVTGAGSGMGLATARAFAEAGAAVVMGTMRAAARNAGDLYSNRVPSVIGSSKPG